MFDRMLIDITTEWKFHWVFLFESILFISNDHIISNYTENLFQIYNYSCL